MNFYLQNIIIDLRRLERISLLTIAEHLLNSSLSCIQIPVNYIHLIDVKVKIFYPLQLYFPHRNQ
jgi:hypothetical protein